MSHFPRSKALACASLFAILILAGCERKAASTASKREQPDVRLTKTFAANTPWFCRIPLLYSVTEGETTKTVKSVLIATDANKTKTYAALTKSCEAADAAPKKLCAPIIAADQQLCVGAALFDRGFATAGVWQCEISFLVDDQSETIKTETFSNSSEAIASAFKTCAELKDAEIADAANSGTKRREACAKEMIERKMTCTNLNASTPTPPSPPEPKRHLSRKPRK